MADASTGRWDQKPLGSDFPFIHSSQQCLFDCRIWDNQADSYNCRLTTWMYRNEK